MAILRQSRTLPFLRSDDQVLRPASATPSPIRATDRTETTGKHQLTTLFAVGGAVPTVDRKTACPPGPAGPTVGMPAYKREESDMETIGKVLAINAINNFVAVRSPNGVTVFELMDDHAVSRGDMIKGDLESLTGELFFNMTRKDKINVVVQDINCSPDDARRLLRA